MNTKQFKLLLDSELSKFKETTLEVELFAARISVAVLEGAYEALQPKPVDEETTPLGDRRYKRHKETARAFEKRVGSVGERMAEPKAKLMTVRAKSGKVFVKRVPTMTPEEREA